MIFRPYYRFESGCAGYVSAAERLEHGPPEPADMQQILAVNRGHAAEAVR